MVTLIKLSGLPFLSPVRKRVVELVLTVSSDGVPIHQKEMELTIEN